MKVEVMLLSQFLSRRLSTLTEQLVKTMRAGYTEAIEALNTLQSNVDYIKHSKVKNNQENNMSEMEKFLQRSGISLEQLDSLPVIHIAGTNGKGTTCSYCESILRSHGYKTGFYSSPHLLEVRERIRLNGVPLSQETFADYFWKVYNNLEKEKSTPYDMPLYFRFLTLMALQVFLTEKVDVAILEVGIGGEYDCTNIVRNTIVAGITPLDIDHTTLLGNSLESIAWNKAGIMKPGAHVFTAHQPNSAMKVLMERSVKRNCTLRVIEDLYFSDTNSRIPRHIQKINASLALSICRQFINSTPKNNNNIINATFNLDLAKQAIESSKWPGRYEVLRRRNSIFYLDGAHTVESMQICSEWFLSKTTLQHQKKRVLLFNVTGERDPRNLLSILLKCQFDIVIFLPNIGDDNDSVDSTDIIQPVNHQLERCQTNKRIWEAFGYKANVEIFPSFAKTVLFLEKQENQEFDVLVTGSIHLIGAALSVLDPTLSGIL